LITTTVITGSYTGAIKPKNNFENIIVNYNDTGLNELVTSSSKSIKNKYYPDEPKTENEFYSEKIIKRLEILKNFIILEDIDDVKMQLQKNIQFQRRH
jgi:hypothetical protein